ncbi:hypothetical protein AB0C10_06820 [Microbispora amethystogenes]|uniref:hypothetical protein n=1 Tax=Microbispora amethystogenes TaxID=1427754 RepID=UPI0033F08690
MVELGSRERRQPPPAHVVWESLTEPRRQGGRQWLDPRPDEVEPRLPRAVRPEPVVLVVVLGVAIGAGAFWLLTALWRSSWGDGPQFLLSG